MNRNGWNDPSPKVGWMAGMGCAVLLFNLAWIAIVVTVVALIVKAVFF